MSATVGLRTSAARSLLVRDTVLAVLALAFSVVNPPEEHGSLALIPAPAIAVAVLMSTVLVLRRRRPAFVLAACLAGSTAMELISDGGNSGAVAVMIALYTVAATTDRRTTWVAWGVSAATTVIASAISSGSIVDPHVLSSVPWVSVAAAVGDGLRNRRAYVAAIEERAVRAEQSRQEEALRQVAEERVRIARELHDVLAHRIAVVNVQAGVAEHLLESRPDAAREALGHVREAGRAILDEIGDILTLLRQPGDVDHPRAPAPRMSQLDDLARSFAAAGLQVDWSLTGAEADVGPVLDLVAYRLVQEALTNAHKHGTGTARVSVSRGEGALGVTVVNPLRDADREQGTVQPEAGHGLTGMRERAVAVGGVLQASRQADGTFRVTASLPVTRAAAS